MTRVGDKPVSESEADADAQHDPELHHSAIAVVGMACHFPGAKSIDAFWHNLTQGTESVRRFSREELLAAGESEQLIADPGYVPAQPVLEQFDHFDAQFWGFNPQDAAVTDPAHRQFLEVALHAFEHAGHTGLDEEGTVGVFASSGASQYWMQNLQSNPELMASMGEFLVRHTGNDMNFLATRLSYELDLKGPSINIQTACSSALVAIHYAVASLLSEECDFALAGASTVLLPQGRGYLYRAGEILSPDGHCRPFDAQSAGTIFGSGAGAVVLRRLEDALADGDQIHAVIRGSAINNDGSQKIGFLAPGVEGQAAVITEALALADVEAEQIGYVEAHGTGTLVGDPIEIEALKQAFADVPNESGRCLVGSVKSNIGHLGEAAGIAAFIKAVLVTKHGLIPPTPNFREPNPEMDIGNSPFAISAELTTWQPTNGVRMSGITALGAGGTNAHVVIEQGPPTAPAIPVAQGPQILPLSAKSGPALAILAAQLSNQLGADPAPALADVAFTLSTGRRPYKHRAVVIAKDVADAVVQLDNLRGDKPLLRDAPDSAPKLVFMFPGGGAQYAGMGAGLYAREPVYAAAFDAALGAIPEPQASDIRRLVLMAAALDSDAQAAATRELEAPARTLTALLATEYALAKLLISWGAVPDVLMGHSMGEYTAACLAGVMTIDSAMALVRKRGELFERAPAGAMLSVSVAAEAIRPQLTTGLDIAAINAPELCVVSGAVAAIDLLEQSLTKQGVNCTRIHIDVAAHSGMLDDIVAEFRSFCGTIALQPPQLPVTSNLTGTWLTAEQAVSADYWADHLRHTVEFAANVAAVCDAFDGVFVEIGPGRTLSSLSAACGVPGAQLYNSMRHPLESADDSVIALRTLAGVWASGAKVDWDSYWGDAQPARIPLPGYPFQRQRYWVEPGAAGPKEPAQPQMCKRADIGDWFSMSVWQQSGWPKPQPAAAEQWLLFVATPQQATNLLAILPLGTGAPAPILVYPDADTFTAAGPSEYHLNPSEPGQVDALFTQLQTQQLVPAQILYGWATATAHNSFAVDTALEPRALDQSMQFSFWALFALAKVLCDLDTPVTLNVVTNNLWEFGEHPGTPLASLLLGPVNVLPREAPHVHTRSIDLHGPVDAHWSALGAELATLPVARQVLLHGEQRWTQQLVNSYQSAPEDIVRWVRPGGTYLITGGLGGIGLAVAEHLAKQGAGRIGLVSRSGLPEREQWSSLVAQPSATANRIRGVLRVESLGAQVETVVADVGNREAMYTAIAALGGAEQIHGVIHAAGAMDDQLIMVKSDASAQAVLEAKVRGALVLDQLFSDHSLDFMLLFSSIASFMGLPGQIDYTAANAFLDSLARYRARRRSGVTKVVNWNAWREVGMAAAAGSTVPAPVATRHHTTNNLHPALLDSADQDAGGRLFRGSASASEHWFIAEHQIDGGSPLMPGTGLAELVVSTCLAPEIGLAKAGQALELRDLQFIEALQIAPGQSVPVHVAVAPLSVSQGADISVYSIDDQAPHLTAAAQMIDAKPCELDISELRGQITQAKATDNRFMRQHFMRFGPRWSCIDSMHANATGTEALLSLSLSPQFLGDLAEHPLHPALLDMAIGASQFLIPDFDPHTDFYVPYCYERLVFHDALTKSLYSHVKHIGTGSSAFAKFDVTIADASGKVLVVIEGFTMKRLEAASALVELCVPSTPASHSSLTLDDILQHAITPYEGLNALDRLMQDDSRCQWIVSSVDTGIWSAALDEPSAASSETTNELTFLHELPNMDPDEHPDIPAVEQALLALQDVAAVVVRCFGSSAAQGRWVAWIETPAGGEPVTRGVANSVLAQSGSVLQLDALLPVTDWPTTDAGALDRTALLDPLDSENAYRAPSSDTEVKLAELWCALLGAPRVGVDAHFFELGGHSLLLTRLIARVQKTFGRKLPLEEAYETPTIAAWAVLLDSQRETAEPAMGISRANRSRFRVQN